MRKKLLFFKKELVCWRGSVTALKENLSTLGPNITIMLKKEADKLQNYRHLFDNCKANKMEVGNNQTIGRVSLKG